MSGVTALLSALLAIDDDETWYRNVVRRQARRRGDDREQRRPGHRLPRDRRARPRRAAARDARRPRAEPRPLAVRRRATASSAGRPTGPRRPAPARPGCCTATTTTCPRSAGGRRTAARAIVTNHPRDAAELERRQSDGRGLLHADGASRANILSGDATHSMLTMSTVLDAAPGRSAATTPPTSRAPTASRARSLLVDRRPRPRALRRAPPAPRRRPAADRARLVTTRSCARGRRSIQRDLQVAAVVGDMLAGRPVVYTTFLAYDEVAHHSGIERADTLDVLRAVDREIARIADGGRATRRGRTGSSCSPTTGSRRARRSCSATARRSRRSCARHAQADDVRGAAGGEDEALAYLSAGLTEVARDETAGAAAAPRDAVARAAGGAVALDARRARERDRGGRRAARALGDGLGQPRAGRLPARAGARHARAAGRAAPAAARRAARPPGDRASCSCAPSAAARRARRARRALRRRGPRRGRGPARAFGPNAAAHVLRTDGFAHCPDLRGQLAPTGPTTTRSPRSRSSSARTAGWAASRATRSCSSRATCPIRPAASWGPTDAPRAARLARAPGPGRRTPGAASGCQTRQLDRRAVVHHDAQPRRARARPAAASSITPSCSHTPVAPIAIASSTCAPASSARRKTSTTSTGSSIPCTLA